MTEMIGGDLSVSMMQMELQSIMCVPLKEKEEVFGLIYVDSKQSNREFEQAKRPLGRQERIGTGALQAGGRGRDDVARCGIEEAHVLGELRVIPRHADGELIGRDGNADAAEDLPDDVVQARGSRHVSARDRRERRRAQREEDQAETDPLPHLRQQDVAEADRAREV